MICWAIAEYSTIITDIPEVIGMGIAFKVLFGWHHYIGVLLSFLSTMIFLVRYAVQCCIDKVLPPCAKVTAVLFYVPVFLAVGGANQYSQSSRM